MSDGKLSLPVLGEVDRRTALKAGAATLGVAAWAAAIKPWFEWTANLSVDELLQKHYRELSPEQKQEVFRRLEEDARQEYGAEVDIADPLPLPGVQYAYALNLSICIGCRYCEAACPYHARRFNWQKPEIPAAEVNPNQGYLSNRIRPQGVMEKCTFCLHRVREGRLPACLEACPTGARVFGNVLDPKSEIRWVLDHKRVFVLKEELGTRPRFYYFFDK